MGFFVWVEIVCRGCSKTTAGRNTDSPRMPRIAISHDATKQGWHRLDNDWFCPTCAPKRYEILGQ